MLVNKYSTFSKVRSVQPNNYRQIKKGNKILDTGRHTDKVAQVRRGRHSEEVNGSTTIETLDVQRHLSLVSGTLRVSRVGILRSDVSIFDVMEARRRNIDHTAIIHYTNGPATSWVSSRRKLP